MDAPNWFEVVVLYSDGPRTCREKLVRVATGSTAGVAIACSGLQIEYPQLHDLTALNLGVWGRKCALEQVLQAGDRVEIYRPLLVDPKVARRERFQKQGARAAGLFSRKRAGSKPGY